MFFYFIVYLVFYFVGVVESDFGGEEKDVRYWGCLFFSIRFWVVSFFVCCELGVTEVSER